MSNFMGKILQFARPYKKYAFLNIFFNFLYALFSALSFIALIPMLTVLFGEEEKIYSKPVYAGFSNIKSYLEDYMGYYITTTSETNGPQYTLSVMIIAIILLFLLKNLFNYWANYFITFLRNGVLRDLRDKLYKKTVELPVSYFSEKRKGDIMARISSDVLEIQHSFLSILELIVREPLTIIFMLVSMFIISPKLTLFVLTFIPVSGFIISKVGKSLKRKSDRAQKEQGLFLSLIEETLGGLKIIKSFNSENRFYKRFQESTDRFYKYSNKVLHRQNLSSPLSEFLGILVIGGLLLYGGRLVLSEGVLSGAAFISYMGLAYGVLTPAKALSKAYYGVKKGDAAAERVLEVLQQPNSIEDHENAIEKSSFENQIEIQNCSFKYEDDYVLKNFSLTVPKGKSIALVGQSGSGKSTIANLLNRFYDVTEGCIKMDGVDIKDIKLYSLRSLIGLVTQDSVLFNDTVKGNLLLGNPNAGDDEIIEALKVANAWEFVSALPEGVDTNIGDNGNKLSGGQKQRLSIARAVLKNPPVMILDEATSALDTESERLVQQALENMMYNRTSLVIAHRLSTIQKADLIVVMQKGEIAEQGTHQQLMEKKGIYHGLVSLQNIS
ncbi:MAG TPA: ABC transporter ATP-binding protein [Flavobacteriaceae bacterium]|nr:ABC transporter ATP-binding protein [Flavobacteriaceae bacterium]